MVPTDRSALVVQAREWLADDPDAQTRAELESLLTSAAPEAAADLADRFSGTLQFGTAGLRGALGAGPNRMNRVVVIKAAAGLARYLVATGAQGPVVIGYDARHNSDVFALDTAEVMTGAGLHALVMPRSLPTPVLAYAVKALDASAGVMVTASHNPPQDNGYKVYLGDGSQIVPPADAAIAQRIAAVDKISSVTRGAPGRTISEDLVDSYLDTVVGLLEEGGARDLTTVYTPLHGVGGDLVQLAMKFAGFPAPLVVKEQERPDPEFPTVAFPNPEEPGAMDRALALASKKGVDLVIANDPDADRCAAAIPVGKTWRMLTGDEVGALLATHLIRKGVTGTYAASIVSSSLLGKIAAAAGQPYAETLTGFKWISRAPGLAFGYEEALGYCVDPEHVRDKDGISALLLLCELAASLKAEGRTLADLLDDLAVAHGLHATSQLSIRLEDPAQIAAGMQRLRDRPVTALAGTAVQQIDDLAAGDGGLPPTDGIRYQLAGGSRVIVRPSGTEPKIKCYLEVVQPVADASALPQARAGAEIALGALKVDIRAALGM
ncbi:phospho-sugar mutase [Nocardioides albus]|uniref:Phosphomannomutase n=1 Tax=Nocardioides albus TaxID=1841 RepID=A0A7W5A119_9ACTN|nr:phospho-sugar mutase [Nocardioides albus]MBB3087329.1 phosphomannomutase [Nocardioides albus]GGU08218.1 phosphomannomutase [Nocardioides albus]